ncbi:MAG: DUF6763 family protein [Gammaproteobacteria bacterium]|nr:DUF6763 family protein [Gammaproteobacteria bacterium]
MPTELDPIEGNWYQHLDKGQRFLVVAVDDEEGLIETQHFDGDIEEIPLNAWYQQELDIAEAPENWGGAFDIGTKDDYGTGITDTDISDWSEPLEEIHDFDEDAAIDIDEGDEYT